jgi:hypothetical protein
MFLWRALEATHQLITDIVSKRGLLGQKRPQFAVEVLDSAEGTMFWQRAYWRHPDTAAPTLIQLVRIFKDWQVGDIRDKVNALIGLATASTNIVIEYASSVQQVLEAIQDAAEEWNPRSETLL